VVTEFTIPGKPFGKQRPKFASRGKFVKAYTPTETVNYENLVKYAWMEAGGVRLADGPIEITIWAHYEVPQSYTKKKKDLALGGFIHPGKPDIDNICKIITDAMNGCAYKDDAQITKATIFKCYGPVAQVKVVMADAT